MDSDVLPSATGLALTVGSLIVIPKAWPLAVMQGTILSDPGEIFGAAEKYKGLAEKAKSAAEELKNLVSQENYPDWHADDRAAFTDDHVTPYAKALNQTADIHEGISSSMHLTGQIYTGIGYLSMITGGFIAACAIAVYGTPPPFDVGTDIAANAAADGAGTVFRRSYLRLTAVAAQAGRTLKLAKNAMPALKYAVPVGALAAVGEYAGKSDFDGKYKGDDIKWPTMGDGKSPNSDSGQGTTQGTGQDPTQGTGQDPTQGTGQDPTQGTDT
jgi:hypothetical protein